MNPFIDPYGVKGENSHRETRAQLLAWAQSLPKVALHRHLEGSLRLETLLDIAKEHAIKLPAYETEVLRPHVQFLEETPDFHRYLDKFRLLRHIYASQSAIQRVVREAVFDAANDNVYYLELRFNPVALSRVHDFSMDAVVAWVVEATEQAQQASGVRTCLILQIGREEPLEVAEAIVDIAIHRMGDCVRAIDLAGDEVHYPPQGFVKPFRRAQEAGLHLTVHAGEAVGPESVRAALEHLDAERIGHGVRSIEDPAVVELLLERGTPLEVCPTSNLQTGVVDDLAHHPLRPLMQQGVRATINTDNPSISTTTLSEEYVVAIQKVGVDRAMVLRALRNAVEAAFIPDAERPRLRNHIREALVPHPEALRFFEAAGS